MRLTQNGKLIAVMLVAIWLQRADAADVPPINAGDTASRDTAGVDAQTGAPMNPVATFAVQKIGQSETILPWMKPGQTRVVWVDYKNVGTATWDNVGGVSNPNYMELKSMTDGTNCTVWCSNCAYHFISLGEATSWINCNRITNRFANYPVGSKIAPGQTARFQFYVEAHSTPGTCTQWAAPWATPGCMGNAVSFQVQVDGTPPSAPSPVTASPTSSRINSFTMSWPASSDGQSGFNRYLWRVNGGPLNATSATSIATTASLPGTNTFEVVAEDNVGNQSWGSTTFYWDTSPLQPQLTLSTSSMSFSTTQGTPASPQSFNIVLSEGGTLSWSIDADVPWLRGTPANGSGSASGIQVFVDDAGLSPGTRTGHLNVTAPGAIGSPQSIVVTFNLSPAPVCPSLAVNPFYQTDVVWKGDIYDHAGAKDCRDRNGNPIGCCKDKNGNPIMCWNPPDKTIKGWGCALTSLAMIAKYYCGANPGADGLPINPRNLNNWFKTHGGYSKYGDIVGGWALLGKYTGYRLKQATPFTIWPKSDKMLTDDMNTDKPAVLEVKYKSGQHFVVATGKSDCSHYDIVDPYWPSKTSLSAYGNSWVTARRYLSNYPRKVADTSPVVLVTAYSDMDMLVTDSLGQRTGYDPVLDSVFDEIPSVSYFKDYLQPDTIEFDSVGMDTLPARMSTTLYFDNSDSHELHFTMFSYDTSGYEFDVTRITETSDTAFVSTFHGALAPGQQQDFSFHIGSSCCIGETGNVDCDPADVADISDLTQLVDFLYVSFQPLCCPPEANIDGQPGIDISDLSALVDYLYVSFTPPAACQ